MWIGLYASPGGPLIRDLTIDVVAGTLRADAHGPADLDLSIAMSEAEAFELYDRTGVFHVEVVDYGGAVVWAGRVEDAAVVVDDRFVGLRLRAFGYQRAFSDVPYHAVWSTTSLRDWRIITGAELANRNPDLFVMRREEGALFIGLEKNTTYPIVSPLVGSWTLETPTASARQWATISLDYQFLAPASTFRFRIETMNRAFGANVTANDLDSNGSLQTGSLSLTLTANDRVVVSVYNYSAGAYTYTGESGVNYLRVSNIRVKTTTSSTVDAGEIVRDLVASIRAVNASQLASTTLGIGGPGTSLFDEDYRDLYPAAVIDRLAAIGAAGTPATPYVWEVDEDRVVWFIPRGWAPRTMEYRYDLGGLDVGRSLSAMRNSLYAVYRAPNGIDSRTATAENADAVALWGITRRRVARADTTNATEATTIRDVALADEAKSRPSGRFVIRDLYTPDGTLLPPWIIRPGDLLVARNLPPDAGADVERLTTFTVREMALDLATGEVEVSPELPAAGLDIMLARTEAGVDRRYSL